MVESIRPNGRRGVLASQVQQVNVLRILQQCNSLSRVKNLRKEIAIPRILTSKDDVDAVLPRQRQPILRGDVHKRPSIAIHCDKAEECYWFFDEAIALFA